jgi:hypothetical protein
MNANAKTHDVGTSGTVLADSLSKRDLIPNAAKPGPRAGALVGADADRAIHELDAAHRTLADERTAARVADLLRTDGAIRSRARNVYVSVTDGIVTLYGAVRDRGAVGAIEAAVRTNGRIDVVCDRIHAIGPRLGD